MTRTLAAAALVLTAVAVTAAGNWWVTGPGTAALRREPVVEAEVLPEIAVGQQLSFADGANGGALLWGWNTAEAWGVWSFGHRATIGLRVRGAADAPADPRLVLHLHAYLAARVPTQRVEAWAGGIKLGEYTLAVADQEISVPLSGVRLASAPLLLTLVLPDAISPYDAQGIGDYRMLAVGLISLRLTQ